MQSSNLYHFTWRFHLFQSLVLFAVLPFFTEALFALPVESDSYFVCNKTPEADEFASGSHRKIAKKFVSGTIHSQKWRENAFPANKENEKNPGAA